MADLDFAGLNRTLLDNSQALLRSWLPGGALSGTEYICGDAAGGKGRSFSVNWQTGKWAEFNGLGGKGGDLISLYAYLLHNKDQGKAFHELAAGTSMAVASQEAAPPVVEARITQPPVGTPPPKPQGETSRWAYKDAAGNDIFYVLRWDKDGDKTVRPVSWDADAGKWIYKGYPDPRPLRGLEKLAARPGVPVMLVEGEKSQDAAELIVGERYVVMTWPNGAAAEGKADWSPLYGRKVHIWQDADLKTYPKKHPQAGQLMAHDEQPGRRVALAIADLLVDHCPEVKVLDAGEVVDRKDGWDAADALAEGWDWARLFAWAKGRAPGDAEDRAPRMQVYVRPAQAALPLAPLQAPADPAPSAKVQARAVGAAGKRAVGAAVSVEMNIDDGEAMGQRETFSKVWSDLGLAATRAGAVANVDNVLRVLENRDEFSKVIWWDEFHQKILTKMDFRTWDMEDKPRVWRDVDNLYLLTFMQRHLGMTKISESMVKMAVHVYAYSNVRNEPQEWLNSLVWDQQPRLEGFFSACFGVTYTEYSAAVSKNFWIAMVARLMDPGCQVDNMVILEGDQGAYKSSALRMIGRSWHVECRENILSKDFSIGLKGRSLVIINEWDKFKKTDAAQLKDIISTPVDSFRPLYQEHQVDHGRTCIFIATTNKQTYLLDNTGARRYWPLRTKKVSKKIIAEILDQCYAEALAKFRAWQRSGDDKDGWWLVPEAETREEQEARRVADEWEEIFSAFLESSADTTVKDLWVDCLKMPAGHLDAKAQHRIGECLRAIGWYPVSARVDGRPVKLFKKKEA